MVKELPPGQGLGGAVGGNLIDPNLTTTVCESVHPRVHLGSHAHTVWELRGMKKHSGQRFLRFQRRSGSNPSRVLCAGLRSLAPALSVLLSTNMLA